MVISFVVGTGKHATVWLRGRPLGVDSIQSDNPCSGKVSVRVVPEVQRSYMMEYVLAVVVVLFVGTAVWAGLGWWELNQAGSLEAESAFRSALREAERTGGAGWGMGRGTVQLSERTGTARGGAMPTLDMMLQGATSVPGAGQAGAAPAAPSIDKSFDQINDVLQGR